MSHVISTRKIHFQTRNTTSVSTFYCLHNRAQVAPRLPESIPTCCPSETLHCRCFALRKTRTSLCYSLQSRSSTSAKYTHTPIARPSDTPVQWTPGNTWRHLWTPGDMSSTVKRGKGGKSLHACIIRLRYVKAVERKNQLAGLNSAIRNRNRNRNRNI